MLLVKISQEKTKKTLTTIKKSCRYKVPRQYLEMMFSSSINTLERLFGTSSELCFKSLKFLYIKSLEYKENCLAHHFNVQNCILFQFFLKIRFGFENYRKPFFIYSLLLTSSLHLRKIVQKSLVFYFLFGYRCIRMYRCPKMVVPRGHFRENY